MNTQESYTPKTTAEIEAAVDGKLAAIGISVDALYVGETKREQHGGKPWQCDQWAVSIGKGQREAWGFRPIYTTSYYTGLGLRKSLLKSMRNPSPWQSNAFPAKPQKPTATAVLSSLLLDAEAIDESFADWCSNYGYDDDSISALETYRACCATGEALRRVFSRQDVAEFRELLQDY